jgi:hypothetical protein
MALRWDSAGNESEAKESRLIIETTDPEESSAVFAWARRGLIQVNSYGLGKSGNASWRFNVTAKNADCATSARAIQTEFVSSQGVEMDMKKQGEAVNEQRALRLPSKTDTLSQ